ncbi:unnamed protein product [Rotaria sordida]|uniref:Uncharacterized protein n=1 Tax=Rotaria sordida TaxID=392033 RepID=A0A819LH77_9BILA|nr:unnamed protein product [Rotaria sordida]CAF3961977.1 unnamed protein product [Rotaria sordida]
MFDRLCFYILPQIQHNVQCLTLDPWSMISVLSIGNYPKLHKLTLIHHKVEMADQLDGLPSECYSSIIVHLNVKVKTFNDCLWLLNGHLSQLHTLVVHVEYIHNTSKIINNKKLTVSLYVHGRTSFIDGTHLNNDIISKIPYLHRLNFDIITEIVIINNEYLPTSDDIRRALIEKGYNVD